jgi:hypothetical protein
MSWSCESCVLRTRTTFVSCGDVSTHLHSWRGGTTYGVVGLARLAEGLRCVVDLVDHFGEVVVEFIEAIRELFGQFVAGGMLVVCSLYQ